MASSSLQQKPRSTKSAAPSGSEALAPVSTRQITARREAQGSQAQRTLELGNAAPCDLQDIGRLLITVHQRPRGDDYALQLEQPHDEPCDRLIVKRGKQLVGHIQLQWRSMCHQGRFIPFCRLAWLAVLPEYRAEGVADWLIETALQAAKSDHALLIEVDSTIGPLPAGTFCARGPFNTRWQDSPRNLLSTLSDATESRSLIEVRNWRQMELDDLCEVYDSAVASLDGPLCRGQSHWRWLIERAAHDHLFVALRDVEDQPEPRLVGYCVSRREHLLELLTLPGEEQAAVSLLHRASRDAIERGFHRLVLHGHARHPLGDEYFRARETGASNRIIIPRTAAWLRSQRDPLVGRAADQGWTLPWQLSVQTSDGANQLEITRRRVSLESGKSGRRSVRMSDETWAGALLGSYDRNQVRASSARVEEQFRQLFPLAPWWRPIWDDLSRG